MSRLAWFFNRFSRPVRLTIQLGIVAAIVAAVAGVGFIEVSAQPAFCKTCHIMRPYYASWASSSHNTVPCIQCHYAPGIRAEAMGKFQAANQVVKYVTGTYGSKPWAEIEDAACLRSGCHVERRLEGEALFHGIRFDHTQHLGELRRGKQLRCTSCHSQIVQGEHVAVTEGTCFLCHFKGRPAGEPIAGCTGCHVDPPRVVSPAGFVVDHPQYVRDLVSCVSCHEEVTSGTGAAERPRCFTCHNDPGRIAEFENTSLVHRVHIADHNVECAQCHTPIEHRVVALSSTFELDCNACHQQVHDAQRRMYAGLGGHGTAERPSAMFLASVSCQSCHDISRTVRGHERVEMAGEATCLSCHGIRYANILPSWQREMERKVGTVDGAVRGARAALSTASVRGRATADSLLRLAGENLEFVRLGRGVHNIVYADQLLRAAADLVRQAVARGGLAYRVPPLDLGPPVGENVCLQCHLGIERRQVTFEGASFNHEPHVLRADLPCTTCHTPLDQHGGMLLETTQDCADCHHRQIDRLNCATCHEGPGGAPETPIATPTGLFPHARHLAAGFPCAACHGGPTVSAANLDCETCHDLHHHPTATCTSCHRESALPKHPGAAVHEFRCSQCHGDRMAGVTAWSRQVCTACHTDRVDHNAPVDCVRCHEIASPWASGGGR